MINNPDFLLGTYRAPPHPQPLSRAAGGPHPRPLSRVAGGPHPQPLSRAAGGPHPRPLSRAAGEGWFVNAVSLTAAGSLLLRSSPLPLPRCGRPSPLAPLPRCGRGVIWFVRSLLLRSSPLSLPVEERKGGWGEGEGRHKFLITLSHSSRWLDARSTRRLQ